MTPKEKAKYLYDSMYTLVPLDPLQENNDLMTAKNCALMAVNEIIKTKPISYGRHGNEDEIPYWKKVKTEIENLWIR